MPGIGGCLGIGAYLPPTGFITASTLYRVLVVTLYAGGYWTVYGLCGMGMPYWIDWVLYSPLLVIYLPPDFLTIRRAGFIALFATVPVWQSRTLRVGGQPSLVEVVPGALLAMR